MDRQGRHALGAVALRSSPKHFGAELKSWRQLLGVTQADIAAAGGVTRPTVSDWENRSSPPAGWDTKAQQIRVDLLASVSADPKLLKRMASDLEALPKAADYQGRQRAPKPKTRRNAFNFWATARVDMEIADIQIAAGELFTVSPIVFRQMLHLDPNCAEQVGSRTVVRLPF